MFMERAPAGMKGEDLFCWRPGMWNSAKSPGWQTSGPIQYHLLKIQWVHLSSVLVENVATTVETEFTSYSVKNVLMVVVLKVDYNVVDQVYLRDDSFRGQINILMTQYFSSSI